MTKKTFIMLAIVLFMTPAAFTQVIQNFQFNQMMPDRSGLVGNGITDLLYFGTDLYVGTGYGLSVSSDNGESWKNYTPREYKGEGGISAITVADDGTLWIATGYDSTINGDNLSVGGGLRYRLPGGNTWNYIPQPVDARSDTANGKHPTTTIVQNITFDIAVLDTQIWIASFGGGVRRSLDMGATWETITIDGNPFDVINAQYGLAHRGFSVMAENGNIWAGTAGGIGKSSDGGKTWQQFSVKNGEPEPGGISGNWCIALAHNPWDGSVWAATLNTEGDEFNAVCKTTDGGATWQTLLKDELSDGTFPRDISFYDSITYVATEKGVYKSIDGGASWYKFPSITDQETGERLLTSVYYSVIATPGDAPFHRVWLGSADGLAESGDNGYNWTIFRSFVSTRQRTDPAVYAYPNPFSPMEGDYVRFQYDVTTATTVDIDIYNYAMEKVISIVKNEHAPVQNAFDRSVNWDGRDNNGRLVDNGVYFFRAKVEGKVTWGKIVVIN